MENRTIYCYKCNTVSASDVEGSCPVCESNEWIYEDEFSEVKNN